MRIGRFRVGLCIALALSGVVAADEASAARKGFVVVTDTIAADGKTDLYYRLITPPNMKSG